MSRGFVRNIVDKTHFSTSASQKLSAEILKEYNLDSPKFSQLCEAQKDVELIQCINYTSGYTKEWLLRHHYAGNRSLTINKTHFYMPLFLQDVILSAPNEELIVSGKILWESFMDEGNFQKYLFLDSTYNFITSTRSSTLILHEPVFILSTRWSSYNYYHWLIECLPRLYIWKLMRESNPNIKILVRDNMTSGYHRQWFTWLGISDNDLIIAPHDNNVHILRAIYQPIIGNPWFSFAAHHALTELIKTSGVNYVEPISSSRGLINIAFICRKPGSVRSIYNLDALRMHYPGVKLTCYFAEDLLVDQQIGVFSSAHIVVGVHGAGLSNASLCSAGSILCEIHTETMINPCYYDIACASNLGYAYIVAKYVPGMEKHQILSINPQDFSDMIEMCIDNVRCKPL